MKEEISVVALADSKINGGISSTLNYQFSIITGGVYTCVYNSLFG